MKIINQYGSVLAIRLLLSLPGTYSDDVCRGTKTHLNLKMYQARLNKAGTYLSCIMNCQTVHPCKSYAYSTTNRRCTLFDRNGQSFSEMCQARGYTFLENSLSCVKVHSRRHAWSRARRVCRREGADLAMIKDETKQKDLSTLMAPSPTAWIGLRDPHHSNRFQWVDGSPLVYTAWDEGQPSHSYKGGREDCVQFSHLHPTEHLWNDGRCKYPSPFVCEVGLNVLK